MKRGPHVFWTLIALASLWFLWRFNADKLGAFYDYSIIAAANGYLHAGLFPFRDFTTPLPSMIFNVAYSCEWIFGPAYMALAYGNLILTLVVFSLTLWFASRTFDYRESLLIAVAVCIGSTLQHGIVWYNCLGLLWLIATSFLCFAAVARSALTLGHIVGLSVVLCFAGATKANFLIVGLAIAGSCIAYLALTRAHSWMRSIAALIAIAICAVAGSILFEAYTCHTDIATYLFDTFRLPAGRSRALAQLVMPGIWFGQGYRFYGGNAFWGMGTIALGLSIFVLRSLTNPGARLAVVLFFGLTMFLCATNVDIVSVSGSMLGIGMVSVRLGFGAALSEKSARVLRLSVLSFATWFCIAGFISIASHARIAYGAEQLGIRFHVPAEDRGYLKGVFLSEQAHRKLVRAASLLEQQGIGPGSERVYWGPGLELLGRQFDTRYMRGVPLWYHVDVTVRPQDVSHLIQLIESSPIRLIVGDDEWMRGMPADMQDYLGSHWNPKHIDGLVYYLRP